eukprot:6438477-Amphidinium_carterae.1
MCGNSALGRSLIYVLISVNMPKAGAEAPMYCAAALVVLWAAECAPWASAAAASIWHVKHTWKR